MHEVLCGFLRRTERRVHTWSEHGGVMVHLGNHVLLVRHNHRAGRGDPAFACEMDRSVCIWISVSVVVFHSRRMPSTSGV